MTDKQKRIFKITVFAIIAILIGVATFLATRWVLTLRNPDKLAAFQDLISSLGPGGFFVLLAIQYIQIVIAFIPGGPIQIAAGALYGPLGGFAVCIIGTVLATCTVFYLVRRFGNKVISLFVDAKDISKYKFLKDSKKLETLTIILFFIPGTPKDALTYIFALTTISPIRFIILSTVARMPAMVTSIFAGDSISNGDWMRAGILFIAITIIGAVGFLIHQYIMKRHRKK